MEALPCGNCGFTIWDCWSVSKRGAWPPVLTTAEALSPPTHKVSRDQLCVTQRHNQSVDIASIDSPQKSLLLFDDLLPLFFSFFLTSLFALWFLCPYFNSTATFKSISIFFSFFHPVLLCHHHPLSFFFFISVVI